MSSKKRTHSEMNTLIDSVSIWFDRNGHKFPLFAKYDDSPAASIAYLMEAHDISVVEAAVISEQLAAEFEQKLNETKEKLPPSPLPDPLHLIQTIQKEYNDYTTEYIKDWVNSLQYCLLALEQSKDPLTEQEEVET